MSRYKIVRMFFNSDKRSRVIQRGLTLDEAQTHCSDPETSSRTCTTAKRVNYTRRHGAWFDGYELESTK
jgi:hypothetical protein